jgi:hypothetical protein
MSDDRTRIDPAEHRHGNVFHGFAERYEMVVH